MKNVCSYTKQSLVYSVIRYETGLGQSIVTLLILPPENVFSTQFTQKKVPSKHQEITTVEKCCLRIFIVFLFKSITPFLFYFYHFENIFLGMVLKSLLKWDRLNLKYYKH